ncbi:SH3 domain-containing kinase-binding protein 1 isoform X2 [Centroberyx gerrardi]
MEVERKDTKEKREELDSLSSTLQENTQATCNNESVLPTVETKTSLPTKSFGSFPRTSAAHPFSTLSPEALSAVLRPAPPPCLTSDPKPGRNPAAPNLEQLQTELKDLKDELELMKSQHNKEIKLLMNELDEEKRIRLTLQMEIQRMKKRMSK